MTLGGLQKRKQHFNEREYNWLEDLLYNTAQPKEKIKNCPKSKELNHHPIPRSGRTTRIGAVRKKPVRWERYRFRGGGDGCHSQGSRACHSNSMDRWKYIETGSPSRGQLFFL